MGAPISGEAPGYTGPAWLGQVPRLVADNRGLIGHGQDRQAYSLILGITKIPEYCFFTGTFKI